MPEMSELHMELLRAYFWLRNSNPGGGFGHSPIPPSAYLDFTNLLLSGLITDVSIMVLMPGFASIMHEADMMFLKLENEKEKMKSKPKGKK